MTQRKADELPPVTDAAIELATKRVQRKGFWSMTTVCLFFLVGSHLRCTAKFLLDGLPSAGAYIATIFAIGAAGVWVPDIIKAWKAP